MFYLLLLLFKYENEQLYCYKTIHFYIFTLLLTLWRWGVKMTRLCRSWGYWNVDGSSLNFYYIYFTRTVCFFFKRAKMTHSKRVVLLGIGSALELALGVCSKDSLRHDDVEQRSPGGLELGRH